jgi:phage FluMu gp28-like protein
LKKSGHITLVHLKRFALGTEYQAVIEYLRLVGERFLNVRAYYIDQTGVGEAFPENARRAGLKNVKGIELSLPRKSDVMTQMKQVMEQKRLHIPRDRELVIEMSAEIAEKTQAGKTKFHHRSGTHDDRLWALALAIYASRSEIPKFVPFAAFGHISKHPWERAQIRYPIAGTSNSTEQYKSTGQPVPWPPPKSRV